MTQPDLLACQRKLLHAFRQAETLRQETQIQYEAGRAELQRVGLARLLDSVGLLVPATVSETDTAAELWHSVTAACQALTDLRAAVVALLRWRERRRKILTSATAVSILLCIALVIVGYLAYRQFTLDQHYQQATTALEAQQWDVARIEIQTLLEKDANYRDVSTLLRESYYRPAMAAIQAGQWDTAAEAIMQLNHIEYNYRDVPDLIAANPALRQSLVACYGKYWLAGQVVHCATLEDHSREETFRKSRSPGPDTPGPDDVRRVAFSPDGTTLASASVENNVRLWWISDGALLQTLKIAPVVAFSPDWMTLASGSYEPVRLWRVSDGSLLRPLEGHTDYVESVAFSPDGVMLASGSWDKTVRLWQVSDGSLLRILEHDDRVWSVAFSPDGATLASGTWGGTVQLWRISDGALLCTLKGHTGEASSVAFNPDGAILASGAGGDTVRLWRVSDGALLRTLGRTEGGRAPSFAFSPDGMTLASNSRDTVQLWRISDGSLLRTLEGHTGGVESVAFSPDGALLAVGINGWHSAVVLWQAGK